MLSQTCSLVIQGFGGGGGGRGGGGWGGGVGGGGGGGCLGGGGRLVTCTMCDWITGIEAKIQQKANMTNYSTQKRRED